MESSRHNFGESSGKKPFVSVICPIRNEEDYIFQCLESLVNQSYDPHNMEILVMDGMSDDQTRKIVHKYEEEYSNIHLVDNPKRYVSSALNIGIRQARGKYIIRMDGHAKAALDFVEKSIAALQNNEADCAGGPIISLNDTETGKAIALAMSSPFGVGNSRFRTSVDKQCYVDTLAFPAFKREVFSKVGLFDEEMVRCQDDEFNFRIRKFGGKILLTPEIKSCYYPRGGFKKLWRQYFGYGLWKIRVWQKHFWKMQLRHFFPVGFVLSLLLPLILSFFIPGAYRISIGILGLYFAASILAAGLIRRRNREVSFFKILLSFYILHFSYGIGFLWGLIKFAHHWFDKETYPTLAPAPEQRLEY